MALKKKKKKIIKKVESQPKPPEPVIQPEPTPEPAEIEQKEEKEFELPYTLTSEYVKKERQKQNDLIKAREDQINSFVLPDGYKHVQVIEHKELPLEDECPQAEKELNFWKKYKPDRFYEIARHGTLVTFIIARRANKTEEVDNLRKKRKKAQ